MAKAKNGNNWATKVRVISVIAGLLAVFAGLVAGFCDIGGNTKAIEKHVEVDDARDKELVDETDKLENSIIGIEKDIGHINEGMAEQKKVSKERYDEQKAMLRGISDEIKAIHRSP